MFKDNDTKQLTQALKLALHNKNESPFFAEKATPLIEAIYLALSRLKSRTCCLTLRVKKLLLLILMIFKMGRLSHFKISVFYP